MSQQDETEIFWQAFRYVGEEMSPYEATAFEEQLASNQMAREAVARVVELSQLVLAAAPERSPVERFITPAVRSRVWMQPVGWIAVGAAACLAVVMAYQSFVPATGSTPMALVAPGSSGDLALAWAVARSADLPGAEEAVADRPAGDEGLRHEGNAADVARQPTGPGDLIPSDLVSSGLVAADALAAGDDLPRTDPMEEFTEPVAPAWLLVAVEDARQGASQEN